MRFSEGLQKSTVIVAVLLVGVIVAIGYWLWQRPIEQEKPETDIPAVAILDLDNVPDWVPVYLLEKHAAKTIESSYSVYEKRGYEQEDYLYTTEKSMEEVMNDYLLYLDKNYWTINGVDSTPTGKVITADQPSGDRTLAVTLGEGVIDDRLSVNLSRTAKAK